MVNHISSPHRQRPDLTLTVILPEVIVRRWKHRILHNQTAARLRRALRPLPTIVVTDSRQKPKIERLGVYSQ